MATTTVRLSPEEEAALDKLAERFVRLAKLFDKQIAALTNQGPLEDHQDEYIQTREALLRRWEALRTPLGRFRRVLPQERNDNPLEPWASFRHPTQQDDVGAFYERERFEDQIHDLLVWLSPSAT